MKKYPYNTPLEEWPRGWLVMEVASLYDVPEYISMTSEEKIKAKMPVTDLDMREYIKARRDADAILANPDLLND